MKTLPRHFKKIILTGPVSGKARRMTVRNILIKGAMKIQFEEFVGEQAFHRNLDYDDAVKHFERLRSNFKNINIMRGEADASHDRKKTYIIPDGTPCPPLIKLGIMDEAGNVFKTKMDKFIQINSFLNIVSDAVKYLDKKKVVNIVDYCSGKSYLTFLAEYFFKNILERRIHITGIDAKADVIKKCQSLAAEISCENIELISGDIKNFSPAHPIDIALSLHACDIATDEVLKQAVKNGAKIILAVPCCHKELSKQIKNNDSVSSRCALARNDKKGCDDIFHFILKYGLMRERFAAVLTDSIRANWLENNGYKTDILEFVDFNNTPKNVMIRAVFTGKKSGCNAVAAAARFGVTPSILRENNEKHMRIK